MNALIEEYDIKDDRNILVMKNVTKKSDQVTLLFDINMNIERGEVVCAVGESGCGKTTLARIIFGIDQNYEGEVYIRGKLSRDIGIYERNIRYFSNDLLLFEEVSVLENIMVGFRDECELTHEEKVAKAVKYIDKFNLQKCTHMKARNLSHGQKQRVKIIRTIIDEFDFVILDEPFDGLDISNAACVYSCIRELNSKGVAFLVICHNKFDVVSIAQRVLLIEQGRITCNSSLDRNMVIHKSIIDYYGLCSVIKIAVREINKDGIIIEHKGVIGFIQNDRIKNKSNAVEGTINRIYVSVSSKILKSSQKKSEIFSARKIATLYCFEYYKHTLYLHNLNSYVCVLTLKDIKDIEFNSLSVDMYIEHIEPDET